MSDFAPLFEPFTLKGVTFANRLAMAPMTRSFATGGVPGQNVGIIIPAVQPLTLACLSLKVRPSTEAVHLSTRTFRISMRTKPKPAGNML